MAHIVVTSDELTSIGALTAAICDDLQSGIAELDAYSGSVLGSSWSGMAATSFANGLAEWNTAARQVLNSLEELAHAITTAGLRYDQQERQTAASFAGAGA